MFWNRQKKSKIVEKTQKELIRERLAAIAYTADAERLIELQTHDSFSLVCFVNEDFPEEKQTLHAAEATSDFIYYSSNTTETVQWMDRQKMTGKRDKIIIYKMPAEHMQELYSTHIKNRQEGKFSPFKTISVIIHNGKAYPVAFCLGFLWGSQTASYNDYPSTRI
jgi:hypothetical protein